MKQYTLEQIEDMKKALYKEVKKAIEKNGKNTAQEVIRDVLDANYTAQVDPDKIPASSRVSVVNKSKSVKSQEKGVSKLKKFLKKKGK